MKIVLIIVLSFASGVSLFAQNCLQDAKVVEPVLTEDTRKIYEANLARAQSDYEKNPFDREAIIWLGRRTAYLGKYKEAIKIFSEGIKKFPQDARFYRHRGHRFITIRCFDEAIRDFETAAKLVKGKPDETEPDGLPNARNIPTSTLQSNIFYHLGLAYYLKGNFRKALQAYEKCEKVSRNPDMLVATKHWLYMSLRRLGRNREAQKVIANIKDNLDIIENEDYYKLIKLYQGRIKAEDLTPEDNNRLSSASVSYGIGNWYLYNGDRKKAEAIFRWITSGNQWASFGFIAAERELLRLK